MRCHGMAKKGSRAPCPGGVRAVTSQMELLVVTELPGQGRSRGLVRTELFGQVLVKESTVCRGALRVVGGLAARESNTSDMGEVWGGAELQKNSPKSIRTARAPETWEIRTG